MECHYPLSAGPARNRRLSSWWYYHLKVDKENKTLHDCIIIRMDQKPTLISRRGLQMSTSTSSSFLIDDILVQRPKVGIRPPASRKEVYYTSAMICKIFAKNLSAHSFLSVGYQKKYLCLYDRLSLSPLYPPAVSLLWQNFAKRWKKNSFLTTASKISHPMFPPIILTSSVTKRNIMDRIYRCCDLVNTPHQSCISDRKFAPIRGIDSPYDEDKRQNFISWLPSPQTWYLA